MSTSANGEKRRFMRTSLPFKLEHCLFNFPGALAPAADGKVINISAAGILFISTRLYKIGSVVHLSTRLGSWDDFKTGFHAFKYIYQAEPYIALGKVLRCDRAGEHPDGPVPVRLATSTMYETAVDLISVDPGHQEAVNRFLLKIRQRQHQATL